MKEFLRRHAQAGIADDVCQDLSNKNKKLLEEKNLEHDLRVREAADARVALAEADADVELAITKAKAHQFATTAKAYHDVKMAEARAQAAIAEANKRAEVAEAELRGIARGEAIGYQRALKDTELYDSGFKDGQKRRPGMLMEETRTVEQVPAQGQIEAATASQISDQKSYKSSRHSAKSRSTNLQVGQSNRRGVDSHATKSSNYASTTVSSLTSAMKSSHISDKAPGQASIEDSDHTTIVGPRHSASKASSHRSTKDLDRKSTKTSAHTSRKGLSEIPIEDCGHKSDNIPSKAFTKRSSRHSPEDSGYRPSEISAASIIVESKKRSEVSDRITARESSDISQTHRPSDQGHEASSSPNDDRCSKSRQTTRRAHQPEIDQHSSTHSSSPYGPAPPSRFLSHSDLNSSIHPGSSVSQISARHLSQFRRHAHTIYEDGSGDE